MTNLQKEKTKDYPTKNFNYNLELIDYTRAMYSQWAIQVVISERNGEKRIRGQPIIEIEAKKRNHDTLSFLSEFKI